MESWLKLMWTLPLAMSRPLWEGLGAGPTAGAARFALETSLGAARLTADGLAGIAANGSGLGWRELANKLEAFEAFACAPPVEATPAALAARLAAAMALPGWQAVWAVEGSGFRYAEAALAGPTSAAGLLPSALAAQVPRRAWLPLHTGLGLALASRELEMLDAPPPVLRARLAAFATDCRRRAWPGYGGAVFEALGLTVRTLAPERVAPLDAALANLDPQLTALFWHGVGRGLYFAPTQAVPWLDASQRALTKARQEPPHALGRINAQAGVAWALTLVNLRHPPVVAAFLAGQAGESDAAALAAGVAGAVRIWVETVGEEATLAALLERRPGAAAVNLAAGWSALVGGAVRRALAAAAAGEPIERVFWVPPGTPAAEGQR